ncbi:MAG TPA: ABC transporter ATP-binding protein, partial [bacterium]|nr:ABC transporter ATP-binding protein [bacterium]
GMVFQSYAIWPHMTVFENVALPLTQGKKKLPRSVVQDRVNEVIRLVQLEGLTERPAPLLSGGQQQRVALARALAIKPQALLMDEPLSNLDARLREDVRSEIRSLVKKVGVTVLYVTHDQVEAIALADRIAIMGDGQILQVGYPQELYHHPVNATVAEFFGRMNWLEGKTTEEGLLQTEIGTLHADAVGNVGSSVLVAVRPEDVQLSSFPSGKVNEFEGEILNTTFLGDYSLYQVQFQTKIILKKDMGTPSLCGKVFFWIPKEKIRVFPKAPQGGKTMAGISSYD